MKQIKKYIALFSIITFSLILNKSLLAQSFKETVHFANEQYEKKNYDVALKAFKRLIFFNDNESNFLFYIKVAEIDLIKKDYNNAQFNFGLAYNLTQNDSIKNEILFKKAFSQILNKDYQYAIIDLMSINEVNRLDKKRIDFYLGTCYFGLEQFDRAKKMFKGSIDSCYFADLDNLFVKEELFSPSPKKAKILSMIMPGLGQIYVGRYKDGINSFLLASGLIAIGVKTMNEISFIYSLVSIGPWYQRYFTGGYLNAEKAAVQERKKHRSSVYNRIISLVEKEK